LVLQLFESVQILSLMPLKQGNQLVHVQFSTQGGGGNEPPRLLLLPSSSSSSHSPQSPGQLLQVSPLLQKPSPQYKDVLHWHVLLHE
jgi:hypothetical protein